MIRVTINQCKDVLKGFWWKRIFLVENLELPSADTGEIEILQEGNAHPVFLLFPHNYRRKAPPMSCRHS